MEKTFQKIGFMLRYSWKISKSNFLCAFFKIVLDSLEPFLLLILPKYIIDALTYGRDWRQVLKYIVLYIAVLCLCKIARLIFNSVSAHIINGCDVKSSYVFTEKYLNVDLCKLEDDNFRNQSQRLIQSIHVNIIVYDFFVRIITSIITLAGYTYIIASLHPLLIVFLLAMIGLNALLSKKREKVNYDFESISARFNRRQAYLFNTMIGFDWAKEVRINKAEKWLHEKHGEVTKEYLRDNLKLQKKHLPLNTFGSLISFAEIFVTYVYCAVMAISGSITIGSFSVYTGAIANFSSSFNAVVAAVIHNKYIMKRIDDFYDYLKDTIPEHEKTACRNSIVLSESPVIEFVNVSFRYPNTETDVLKNISLKIEGGKRLAIVGYNGAGKTTLIKLLCRLYEPTEGEIRLDGVNIKDIRYEDYMESLSVVLQDFKLFSFSAAENVVLNRELDPHRLEYCIDKCGLSEKIASLPRGLSTSIGREFDENGIEFSGGEGQKLACARALYKDGNISVMDEPTAALDPIAENELYMRFDQIIGGRTALYISHRLASARFCDHIAVFAQGALVEQGTHDELMERSGVYCEMFNKQAEYYREELAG